jgi:GTPase SAR1 family protein
MFSFRNLCEYKRTKINNQLNTLKVSIWGLEKIGKSLLACKINNREILNDYYPTIGVDFFCKVLPNNQKIYFWDLGGNPKIEHICQKYIEISDITLILYAENNKESIEKANYLINTYLNNKNFLLIQITESINFQTNGKMINLQNNIGISELVQYISNILNTNISNINKPKNINNNYKCVII